ncbi:MAG TPA: sulfotransferase [Pseudonocardiaceae bacterium]|jgi:hypothetical protein|nr:sulfotransferase [Pseudonocardiaceae bacterium]
MSVCRPIIVLGAERSGTSVCAEMVHAWGAYAGAPGELAPADELNPRGRWEYLPLWDLLAGIGDFAAGVTWWAEDLPAHVAVKAADPACTARAQALVARMAATGRPWLWKDPALCHFLGFWRQLWHAPVFIVMIRNPVDIAVSWNQFRIAGGRAATSLACNLLRWQHMMLSVLRAVGTEPATLFAEYEAITSDPQGQARRLAAFLDQHCATATTNDTIATMAEACVPGLRRNRDGQQREELMTAPQHTLYQFLRQKPHQPQSPLTGDCSLPAGWRETEVPPAFRTGIQ